MASEESPNVPQGETESQLSQKEIEKMEEEKLKARYNNVRPVTGHSAFLQKRLAKGQKYFDSGDYQMAKQKGPAAVAKMPMAGPTSSNSTSVASASATDAVPAIPPPVPILPLNLTGDAIPTPESVPTRKTSIIQQSKLAVSPASPAL